MIGVVVTFEDGQKFDRGVIGKIAEEASNVFRGMPGLRNKFFNVELTTRVTGLYGVKPTIEFVDVLELVDNS